jgi:outer membrane protein assembly factor BamB
MHPRAFVRWIVLICLAIASATGSVAAAKAPVVVTGIVFDDANANGKMDAGEKGLAGVRVSDGESIVRTGGDGSYRIGASRARFVFVVTPSGRRCSDGFYRELPNDAEKFEALFALAPCPESANPRFTFAQITDLHVTDESDTLIADLTEIAGSKPSFAVATGDLVNNGQNMDQVKTYAAGLKRSPVPVFNLPGNHDVGGGSKDPENYEQFLGPTHYSFDYGGCHFLMINSCDSSETQEKWLSEDLRLAGSAPVFAFQHYHPSNGLMKLLSQHNTQAIFSGHWHSTKVFDYTPEHRHPVLYVNSPTLRFGGIDISPRGFVLVHVNHGKMRLEHKYGGVKDRLVIVAPADGAEVSDGIVCVRSMAYDSTAGSTSVESSLDGGAWKPLRQSGAMSWSGQERAGQGLHSLSVRAVFGGGEPVVKQVKFRVTPAAAARPQTGDGWSMFHHDAARTGASADAVAPPLTLAWSQALGGSAHAAGPIVVGDTVYVGIADENMAGHAGVYALDLRNGAIKWSHLSKSSIRNAVTYADGTVYALAVDGEVLALDAATGKPRFTQQFDGVGRWLFSSPVVANGVLYVGSGADFRAFDVKTGQSIWTAEEMGGDWISCVTSPAVDGAKLLMGLNWSNGLWAVQRRTGKHAWNAKKGFGTTHATPAVVGGRVYAVGDGKLYALDAATGKVVWTHEVGGASASSPAVSNGKVVVGGGEGRVCCVDAETGKEIWTATTGEPVLFFQPYSRDANPVISSPAISGGVVYCGAGDGKLYAFDMADGKILWSYDLGVPITSSPAVSGNAVFAVTFDGTVYAFASAVK